MTISGPCFEGSDSVECSFGGVTTPGFYMNQENVVCVSPAMNSIGRVEVMVTIEDKPNVDRSASFYSSKSECQHH